MIIRYIGIGMLFGLMTIIGWLVVPFLYFFREYIRDNNITFLWYFLNDTTEGKDAGDYGRFNHNFIGYYKQCAIRNPCWNLRGLFIPELKITNLKGISTLRNYKIWGKQYATFNIGEYKHFRYSITKEILWGKVLWNIQTGSTSINKEGTKHRYVYKFRLNFNKLWQSLQLILKKKN